jgi:invasion protein IalB
MTNRILVALAAFGLALSPATAQQPAGLPGGAQSLIEEHGDWTVSCRTQDADKLCIVTQTLADSGSGRPVVSVELATPTIDRVEGMLLLPFGLQLANGIQIVVDGNDLGDRQPFLTCIATGCLVPVVFDASQVSRLRAGTEMTLSGITAGTNEPMELAISLMGFSRAANRSVELGQS